MSNIPGSPGWTVQPVVVWRPSSEAELMKSKDSPSRLPSDVDRCSGPAAGTAPRGPEASLLGLSLHALRGGGAKTRLPKDATAALLPP
eukprot:CAMPEP_0197882462 /NCGR_PEP_ID=MMETSP1439-20131203/9601_1 /TAXON_ID=66791 /ORGANISM="Gonyaulax spinifera, Strain CCMP409" /LENGTH=87 /DNA_ID=CAMNT_0043502121 /DNA_START=205 /DNA_END=464 /DNA_ORIENTATION=-